MKSESETSFISKAPMKDQMHSWPTKSGAHHEQQQQQQQQHYQQQNDGTSSLAF
jgi:hypothetical protein